MDNIYLLGFMGTGKTSVGKIVAAKLQMQYIDLDDLIESKSGTTIVDIFKIKGQAHFRELETQSLKEISSLTNMVVACGGGIVLRDENLKIMQEKGLAVCLDANEQIIYQRTKNDSHRPLLNVADPEKKIQDTLKERDPFYSKIEYHIDTSELNKKEVANKVIELYNQKYSER